MPNFSEKYKEYARPKLEKKCANFNATAFTEINLHNASSINEFKTLLSKVSFSFIGIITRSFKKKTKKRWR